MIRNTKTNIQALLYYAILVVGAVISVGPFVWMVLGSFKPNVEIMRMPPTFWPQSPSLKNYITVLESIPFFRYYLNSLITGITVTLLALFTSSIAGHIFHHYEFRGRDVIFAAILSTMMIPFQVIMIPLYKVAIDLHLPNTYAGLMLWGPVSTFGIFMMKQFMHSVPRDLIEAARIDGAGHFRIYWQVVLPLIKPALASLGIFTFMNNWDSFMWPLIIVSKTEMRTLPLGLAMFIHQRGVRNDLIMAAATMAVIPVFIVFLSAQRYFVEGITLTGIK
ncbi:MAG: carbohydrate ABC transporter permease [Firmicutes bacterium]|nr:carbohydrate ABC transporter permease [Bacillota bacterium]